MYLYVYVCIFMYYIDGMAVEFELSPLTDDF